MNWWRGAEGSVAVETAIVAPVLLVLMLLVVYAGRASQADADVRSAAARAARAASIADAAAAVDVATATAAANLDTAGVACQDRSVGVDTDAFRAGGTVTVTLACQVSNRDLALLAVPGTRWSVATSTQVVDTHRGGD